MSELFIGTITDGQWRFNNRAHWESWLRLKKNGQYILRPPTGMHDDRSINQNALLWRRHSQLSDATGYTKEEIHDYCMYQSGYVKESEIFGKQILSRISSTKLSVNEFSKLFKMQDEICAQINDGLPIESKLILAATD